MLKARHASLKASAIMKMALHADFMSKSVTNIVLIQLAPAVLHFSLLVFISSQFNSSKTRIQIDSSHTLFGYGISYPPEANLLSQTNSEGTYSLLV